MKLASDASHFPNLQPQLRYTFGLLVGQAFMQVEAYITDEGINLADVPALIMILEIAFRDPDHVATAERKLEMLKQTKRDFSTYYAEFLYYTVNVQWNNPAKPTVLMRGLNNEIKDALALSDNVPQQFHEFVAFLQRLNN
jgi:phosphomannomutase